MSKILLFSLVSILIMILYSANRWGYLLKSYQSLPPQEKIEDKGSASLPPAESDQSLSFLKLPEGYSISYFAREITGARSIAVGGNGTIFVGTRPQGVVYAITDDDHDGRADGKFIVASGLNNPNGVAYNEGTLYVAEIARIIKFDDIDSKFRSQPSFSVVTASLPKATHHGWRYLRYGPDDKLYLGIGAPCNSCTVDDPFGSIIRINTDGSGSEVIARGVRNTVGFDWDPNNNSLWFTDNGRDSLGEDIPPDELNQLTSIGGHFGFPFCHGVATKDPSMGKNTNCTDYIQPKLSLGPHVAALGIHFYQGNMLPLRGNAIIAEHGSWNRKQPIGYRLTSANISGSSADNYQDFVTGWLDENNNVLGRPVDVAELEDGSLLISDDKSGSIYRITYSGD